MRKFIVVYRDPEVENSYEKETDILCVFDTDERVFGTEEEADALVEKLGGLYSACEYRKIEV